jgi:hypothetical protein
MDVANGEQLVSDYLTRAGLGVQRFDKTAMRQGRTPDFRVIADDSLGFYCEVKTVQEDDWLRRAVAKVPPEQSRVDRARTPPTTASALTFTARLVSLIR